MISEILKLSIDKGASDAIISSDSVAYLKIDGEITPITDLGVISKEQVESELFGLISESHKQRFQKEMEFDFALDVKTEAGMNRFRVNAFFQKRGISLVFRHIRNQLPKFEDLHLPPQVISFVNRKSGLLLITGGVGTGKSTTMSVLLDYINSTQKKHIITIEDPVEYVFQNNHSLIEQREVGVNTNSFENGLKYALREASDVIMVGEMRDLETFRLALRAAETGNLVIATLHTSGAARTVSRIIDMFPADEKEQIRQQLSESLIAVIWQDLIKKANGEGRVPTVEILVNATNVSNMIRRGNTHQLNNAIETGRMHGMIPMKKSLEDLYENGYIRREDYENYLGFLGRIDSDITG